MNSPAFPDYLLDHFEVFYGHASAAEARIYARLPTEGLPAGARLWGVVRGPRCEYSRTLEAKVPFIDRGPGDTLLAEAIVPDPCFWTPELPFVYQVEVELRFGQEVRAIARQMLGIRPLGIVDRRWVLDGKPWTLRAVRHVEDGLVDWAVLRQAELGLWADEPTDALANEASKAGVPLIVRLSGPGERVTSSLRRLARWPAVVLAAIESPEPLPAELAKLAPNLPLAEIVTSASIAPLAAWARVAVISGLPESVAQGASRWNCPVVALQTPPPFPEALDLPGVLSNLQTLERALAQAESGITFSGYVI